MFVKYRTPRANNSNGCRLSSPPSTAAKTSLGVRSLSPPLTTDRATSQGLIERFAPQQRTDYVALLNEWAVGFYTELDFVNEAQNQQRLKDLVQVEGVYIPEVYHNLTTRRLLVTEWIDGIKLSECDEDEIRELTALGQECFLVQLLQVCSPLTPVLSVDPWPEPVLVSVVERKDAGGIFCCGGFAEWVNKTCRDSRFVGMSPYCVA